VRAELAAQMERFRSWGREPTHLDSHHHVPYLKPRLFRVLVELAERYRLPIRYPWPQGPLSQQNLTWLAEGHRLSASELPAVIAGCHAILEESSLRTPDRCILSFYGTGATGEHLLDLITGLPVGVSELMCHPGLADANLQAQSGYAKERERELAVLTDPLVREAIQAARVRLVSFSALIPRSEVGSPSP
jgi:predicted glycoside hydrolase/deacetylase ChbG (UPF0249 family)